MVFMFKFMGYFLQLLGQVIGIKGFKVSGLKGYNCYKIFFFLCRYLIVKLIFNLIYIYNIKFNVIYIENEFIIIVGLDICGI